MTSGNGKVWLITGCSSGLGLALGEAALAHGEQVVLTARKPASLGHLTARFPQTALALALDINDSTQIAWAVSQAEDRFGPIDVAVNMAATITD